MVKIIAICVLVLSGCTTMTQRSMDGYKVTSWHTDDIKNPTDNLRIFLYEGWNDTIWLDYIKPQRSEPFYALTIRYLGSGWRFMDGRVMIEINGNLYEFEDRNPNRQIFIGGNVIETVSVVLDGIAWPDEIRKARLQYYAGPMTLDDDVVRKISWFVSHTAAQ
jgi:hypothetical protein